MTDSRFAVVDHRTGSTVATRATRNAARRYADRLDLAFGACRYYVREISAIPAFDAGAGQGLACSFSPETPTPAAALHAGTTRKDVLGKRNAHDDPFQDGRKDTL